MQVKDSSWTCRLKDSNPLESNVEAVNSKNRINILHKPSSGSTWEQYGRICVLTVTKLKSFVRITNMTMRNGGVARDWKLMARKLTIVRHACIPFHAAIRDGAKQTRRLIYECQKKTKKI